MRRRGGEVLGFPPEKLTPREAGTGARPKGSIRVGFCSRDGESTGHSHGALARGSGLGGQRSLAIIPAEEVALAAARPVITG